MNAHDSIMTRSERDDLFTRRAPLTGSSYDAERGTVEAVIAAGAAVRRYDERGAFMELIAPAPEPVDEVPILDSLRANKSETFDCLKFTLEGAGERSDGYARTPRFRLAFLA